jgi:uncharacterized membrane protein/protein-disulfide isomerase
MLPAKGPIWYNVESMSPRARHVILGFALAGLVFASWSAWVHYRLVTEPGYTSVCDVSAAFNCSQVYMSRYGSFMGVPVALAGMIFFGLVALVAGFASPDPKSAAGGYVFALATVGLAVILYLGYASFFVLKTGCLLCIGTYISVIGIFIVSGLTASVSVLKLPPRLASDLRWGLARPGAALALLVFLAGAASVVAFFPKEGAPAAAPPQAVSADLEQQFREAWKQQPRVNLGVPAEGAKVLIVKFLDWQCPACKAAHFQYQPVLQKFAASHPGAVRQVVRDYPLSNKCNFNIPALAHQAACEGAAAVRIARAKGKEEEMIDFFFTAPDQQGVTPEAVKAQAEKLLGITDFDRQYQALLPALRQDVADGHAVGVNSTPTYFVNGVNTLTPKGWLPPHLFELAIKIELEAAGQ